MRTDQDFGEFAAGEHARLVRAAYLLTGDVHTAQDLVQETLIRVLVKWKRVQAAELPAAYARKIMLNVFLGSRRRKWSTEEPVAQPAADTDESSVARVDDRDAIVRLLVVLPPRQRAAVVLRHYEQRSEAETARLLDCPVGTVKSLTARGLARLRDASARAESQEHV